MATHEFWDEYRFSELPTHVRLQLLDDFPDRPRIVNKVWARRPLVLLALGTGMAVATASHNLLFIVVVSFLTISSGSLLAAGALSAIKAEIDFETTVQVARKEAELGIETKRAHLSPEEQVLRDIFGEVSPPRGSYGAIHAEMNPAVQRLVKELLEEYERSRSRSRAREEEHS